MRDGEWSWWLVCRGRRQRSETGGEYREGVGEERRMEEREREREDKRREVVRKKKKERRLTLVQPTDTDTTASRRTRQPDQTLIHLFSSPTFPFSPTNNQQRAPHTDGPSFGEERDSGGFWPVRQGVGGSTAYALRRVQMKHGTIHNTVRSIHIRCLSKSIHRVASHRFMLPNKHNSPAQGGWQKPQQARNLT